ncbi:MAG TPA: hypothetical protein VGM76_02185 [Lacipirellulaceae bacterium]
MATDPLVDKFSVELQNRIQYHRRHSRWNAFNHQALIVVAILSGVASLVAGIYYNNGPVSGLIAIVPSACTLLMQNLHCIRAQNWQNRMKTEIEGIRAQLIYETPNPTQADVARYSAQLRSLDAKMADEWSKATDDYSENFDLKKPMA